MLEFIKKLLGGGSDAEVKKLKKTVDAVEALEDEYRKLTDEQLRAKTDEFRARLSKGETEDDILPEAFATAREASARVLGMRPYRVQVLGGIVLHQGRIAEMKTGEGKTLVATLPAYLNALSGKGDGASQIRVFFAITVPMSKPIIIYTILTSFISPWCDFIFVNTIINDREKYTVALGLYKMINAEKSSFNENFTVFCAGACIVGGIITALFMSMQRYYVEGVTSGAVKG